jgi:cobalt-zinc-cadmium efflux system membrane fusion protein
MKKHNVVIAGMVGLGLLGLWLLFASGPGESVDHGHEEDEHGAQNDDVERGPNGGRVLHDGNVSVEVLIAEEDASPRLRIYVSRDGAALTPDAIEASVALIRLGGQTDNYRFIPREAYLETDGVVPEPHSFDVDLRVASGGASHRWAFPSYESRVTIPTEIARQAGVTLAQAGPAQIRPSLLLYGVVIPDERRIRSVGARFPGVIREVRKNLGDRVAANETLATVESNESLETYPVRSPITGVILDRAANPGENVGDESLFTVADLTGLWAELAVFRRDVPKIHVGQKVRVAADDGSVRSEGAVNFISPVGTGDSQSIKIRVSLDNRDGRWQPGMFVTGEVELAATEVPVAVARVALQKYRDFDVVFANVGDVYEPRMLELGRADRDQVEVTSGIRAGESYVLNNSFLIKADIGKSGASHDH